MKTAYLGALNDGAATLAGFSSWQERLSFQLCKTLENLSDENIVITQAESTDFEAAETAFNALSDYTKNWLSGAVSASSEGGTVQVFDSSYIPELLTFIALGLSGNWGGVFVLFVKVGLEFLLGYTEKKLDPETTTDELAQVFKKFGLDKNAEGDEYSLLWALARQQVRIMIQKGGDFDDAIFEDVATP